eukprot:217563-Rhodomonas_salina.1
MLGCEIDRGNRSVIAVWGRPSIMRLPETRCPPTTTQMLCPPHSSADGKFLPTREHGSPTSGQGRRLQVRRVEVGAYVEGGHTYPGRVPGTPVGYMYPVLQWQVPRVGWCRYLPGLSMTMMPLMALLMRLGCPGARVLGYPGTRGPGYLFAGALRYPGTQYAYPDQAHAKLEPECAAHGYPGTRVPGYPGYPGTRVP